ncbi:MAG: hypothetical protein JWO38_5536 [Gemmataceae bacterium]|nr:hypothetical protein [Gemmataceae bacterium]
MGYTAKKPCRQARQQGPADGREWLEKTYPAIEKRARKEGAGIHRGDETGVAADEYPGCGSAREGQPATIEAPDRYVRMNMISSIGNAEKLRFMTSPGSMTAARFIVFLDRLLRSTAGKIFPIVDRLSAREADAVTPRVANPAGRLEVSPGEYLTYDLKGTANEAGLPGAEEGLRSRIRGFMPGLLKRPAGS